MKWERPKEGVKPDNSVVFVTVLDPCWVVFSRRQVSFEKKSIKNGGEMGLAILYQGVYSWISKLNQMQITD